MPGRGNYRGCMSQFTYQEVLPLGPDETPYRLLTSDYVSTFEAGGRRFVQVEPEALTLLTKTAMFEIAHLLRPGHLAQIARRCTGSPRLTSQSRLAQHVEKKVLVV